MAGNHGEHAQQQDDLNKVWDIFRALEAEMNKAKPYLGSRSMTISDIVYYVEINTILQLTKFHIPADCKNLLTWYEKSMDHPALKALDKHFADTLTPYQTPNE